MAWPFTTKRRYNSRRSSTTGRSRSRVTRSSYGGSVKRRRSRRSWW